MIIIIVLLLANIIWAVLNWKKEFDHMCNCFKYWKNVTLWELIMSICLFAGDLFITTSAVSIFGMTGLYGSVGALFMSNILSIVFFMPKKETTLKLKGLLC